MGRVLGGGFLRSSPGCRRSLNASIWGNELGFSIFHLPRRAPVFQEEAGSLHFWSLAGVMELYKTHQLKKTVEIIYHPKDNESPYAWVGSETGGLCAVV